MLIAHTYISFHLYACSVYNIPYVYTILHVHALVGVTIWHRQIDAPYWNAFEAFLMFETARTLSNNK